MWQKFDSLYTAWLLQDLTFFFLLFGKIVIVSKVRDFLSIKHAQWLFSLILNIGEHGDRKTAPRPGSGFGLGLALELGLGAIFLEPRAHGMMFKRITRKLNYFHQLIKVKKRQYSISRLYCIWDNTNVRARKINGLFKAIVWIIAPDATPPRRIIYRQERLFLFFGCKWFSSKVKQNVKVKFVLIFRCSSSRIKWFWQSNSYSSSSIFCVAVCKHKEQFQVSYYHYYIVQPWFWYTVSLI